jgi:hypothetical protein
MPPTDRVISVQLWRSRGAKSPVEEVDVPAVSILCYQALFDSHFGEFALVQATMAEAISLAKSLNDMHGLAVTLSFAASLAWRDYYAQLHRLRGVFLAAIGADESQIEASFCEAIRIAREQKSISLEKRADVTYAEYRRQKASGSGGGGFRLPLC